MGLRTFGSILACMLFFGCSTLSIYNDADCGVPPEQYGKCFADLGYNPKAFESLAQFCAAKSKPIDEKKFHDVRTRTIAEKCAQPGEVFKLAFRTSYGVNGPEACPKEFLTSEMVQKANQEGHKAGLALSVSQDYQSKIASAEERRETADDKDFLSGLEDRLLQESPSELQRKSAESSETSKKLRDRYPSKDLRSLTERLTCSPHGTF